VYSPYTVGKMIRGQQALTERYEATDKDVEQVRFNGATIKRLLLRKSARSYRDGIDMYLQGKIVERVGEARSEGDDAVKQALADAGFEVVPLPSWERCCGGAGLYNLMQPELSDAVLERKLAEIREGGFDLVATGNPGCIMFLGAGLARAGLEVGVAHPVELVDLAEGNAERKNRVSRT